MKEINFYVDMYDKNVLDYKLDAKIDIEKNELVLICPSKENVIKICKNENYFYSVVFDIFRNLEILLKKEYKKAIKDFIFEYYENYVVKRNKNYIITHNNNDSVFSNGLFKSCINNGYCFLDGSNKPICSDEYIKLNLFDFIIFYEFCNYYKILYSDEEYSGCFVYDGKNKTTYLDNLIDRIKIDYKNFDDNEEKLSKELWV